MKKLSLETTSQFRKDLKLMKKRGQDLSVLDKIIERLLRCEKLETKFRDHALTGDYIGFRECHIRPDWLLIYIVDDDRLVLTASRTGTHSDLF